MNRPKMRVVISQSMYFPWVGLLEQVRMADVFVHYDDVPFSKGSFVNRVQVKTTEGLRWMTVPLRDRRLGQRIDAVQVAPAAEWQPAHLGMLTRSFADAPHAGDALRLAKEVYDEGHSHLAGLARASLLALANYFGLTAATRFVDVEDLGIPGSGSDRVLAIVRDLRGSTYITGHGAARYLDHQAFERAGVEVEYMDYRLSP